jgi:hypothetical protein
VQRGKSRLRISSEGTLKYHHLDLDVFDYRSAEDGEHFRVRVAVSPAGEQKLADAEAVTLGAETRQRLLLLDRRKLDWAALIALGEELAALLFPAHTRAFLTRSLEQLADDEGLRICLKLDTYALADLPWEYAYIRPPDAEASAQRSDGFLVLNRHISIVRYEVLEQNPGTLEPVGTSPLRLVALLANPKDPLYQPLALDVERQNIAQALAATPGIMPEFYPDATVDILEEAFMREAHVFHFAGHGTFSDDPATGQGSTRAGFIVLLDAESRALLFSAERLALNLSGRGVRMAFLGACEAGRRDQVNAWTGVAPALTRAGVPAVLGMQYTVRDTNALSFSQRFYRALAAGQPIDAAVTDGRLAIFNRCSNDERDWGVPVLYLRTEEAIIFPKPQVAEEHNTWADVLERAHEQATRVLQVVAGTPERPGAFIPDAYAQRAAESALGAFLGSPASAIIVIGDSGIGKTNMLCHWASDLLAAQQAVLLYSCGQLSGPDIERTIAQDLSLKSADEVVPALERISALAVQQGRQLVLIFDALNEYRDGDHAGPEALLKNINVLVGHLPHQNVRLVLSCNTATWKQLERLGASLFESRYFQPAPGESVLLLDLFTPAEFADAYERYRSYFHLQTPLAALPDALRERLRKPLLLRMLAEVWAGKEIPTALTSLTLGIFRRYYEERVQRRRDRLFIDDLAAEMLDQRRSTLRVDDLARNERLSAEIVADAADLSYYRLLDAGILTETSGDLVQGDTVQFTYMQVGAYAIALYLLRHVQDDAGLLSTITRLAHETRAFPLAWDTARTLLLIQKNAAVLAGLAQSTDVELRELAVESLVEIYANEPDAGTELIKQILQLDSEEARRTGLKAAYYLGAASNDIFLWVATKGSPELRQAAKDTLYLIWRTNPAFTFGLLNELVSRIGLSAILDLRNMVEFAIALPITIYINHCDRTELIDQLTTLYYELYKNRLHLDLLNTGMLGPGFEKLFFQAVAMAFSQPTLEAILLTEFAPAAQFFDMPSAERACLKRMAALLDPQAELALARAELAAMLGSDVLFFKLVAALVLAIHSYHDFATTRPLIEELYGEINGIGRLWLLLSFAVLLPDTPPDWLPFVEELTRRLIAEHAALYYGDEPSLLERFDIMLLPLGLAYGKHGMAMPYFEQLMRDGASHSDQRQMERCIAGMAVVGFYYPEAVFQTLRAAIPDLAAPALQAVLVRLLSVIRVLHFDAVDIFLRQIGASEDFQRQVSIAADVALVHSYITWLGLYNNAVHSSLFYPKMRNLLSVAALDILADAGKPEDFIARFTVSSVRAAREADYRFVEWTRPA